jgi:hypothetical protein
MTQMAGIVHSALLGIIEQSGMAIATLIEEQTREDLLRSRITRAEVLRRLKALAASAGDMPAAARASMPEVEWATWDVMRTHLNAPAGGPLDDALWFACESLVPATLLWLRVYRKSEPQLFRMSV